MKDSSVSSSKVGAHTPEPWSVVVKNGGRSVTIRGGEIGSISIARVSANLNREANACLIAAAPELAEALRAACPDGIEENCDDCAPGPCAGCWVINARAALAKLDTDSTK